MIESQKATQHRLLPTRRLGDTLIVTPAGSLAGYGVGEVNRELARLVRMLADPEIESLVIDLHGADYFGSEMVGIFVRLQQACRGVTAIVEANRGMRKVFEVMRLDELFSFYGSRRRALKAIAKIPMRQRLRSNVAGVPGRILCVSATCALLAALWVAWSSQLIYQIVGSPLARDYCTLNELWGEFGQLEQSQLSHEEEITLRSGIEYRLEQLDMRVSMRRSIIGDAGPDEVQFQEALRSFESVLHENDDSATRKHFLHYMHCARNSITRRTGLELPAPDRFRETNDA